MGAGPANLERRERWAGLRSGDAVVVDPGRLRGQRFVFVAHVVNLLTGEEWVEVRGGRSGESKTRSFRTDCVYAPEAVRGSRVRGAPLAIAPRLDVP